MAGIDRGYSSPPIDKVGGSLTDRSRYYSLDAMRGFAAICVVATHFQERYAPSAYLAVDFFFVLSGFIIADIYGKRLSRGLPFQSFMTARIKRLYPLYLIGISVGLVQIILLTSWGLRGQSVVDLLVSTIANGAFLPSPMYFLQANPMQGMFPINGPAWSMFWELLVNIVFALWLFRLSIRALCLVALVSAAVLVCFGLKYGMLNIGWEWPSAVGGLPRVMFSFTAGVVISRLFGGMPAWRKGWVAIVPCLLLMICIAAPVPSMLRPYYDLMFAMALAPIIVMLGLFLEMPAKAEALATWIGYISYPVYILHRGVIGVFKPVAGSLGLNGPLAFFALLSTVVCFAYVTARLVDKTMAIRTRRVQ
ncbi:peptidoglycan/LPS O-acetylase OafA/YrhL [Rhizobium leguminosarum]|uniref:Acyltransferase 3 n=2 Tax=Rhizobium leguminosarum TaxID=384 RepID=A0ABF7QYQ3_RHILW|nr:acyltransferase [Rhizobium leguminosarum]ACI59335.1 acyltransferase 3 [Rhizobium leguminosarum bv. trifolii WSM2304]NYJ14092.1 peptidoglycan/LPS O-acetylase OafA/YrhL [Rhizobium leguminosarum]